MTVPSIAQPPPGSKSAPTLSQWLAADRFGLTLSSGFFGFYAHCGMFSALEDAALQPSELSGASAGGLIAALWASGLSTSEISRRLLELDRQTFWDPGFGPGLLRGAKFRALLRELMPAQRFEQCRIPLALSVYDLGSRRTHVIQEGDLVSAVYATCCLPLLFQPIRINRRTVVDGGVADRPGLAGMRATRVLYHHLASRSPWRRKNGAHTQLPIRENLQTLVIDGLPRVGPNKLQAGKQAYAMARLATQQALQQPLAGPVQRLSAAI